MLLRKRGFPLFLPVALNSFTVLHAQYVVAFQGASSSDSTVSVYEPSTLSSVATLSVPGAFQLLSLASSTKHYFISNVHGAGITAVDHSFANPHQVGNVQNALRAAALSPDGSRLVVATAPTETSSDTSTSAVYIFSTDSDVNLTPQGITVISTDIVDVAVNYDGQTAYALGNDQTGKSYLAAISLQKNTVARTLQMGQVANGLALGPNGLLYVSAQKKILEVDPTALIITSVGTIDVDVVPRKLVFTPDGNYGLAASQTFDTGPAVELIDLRTHSVAGIVPYTGLSASFDKLMPASSSVIYAFSSAAQSLYGLQIGSNGGLILNTLNVPGVSLSSVSAAGLSNDFGVPGRNYPQFLFVVSGGILYRIDPATSTMSQLVGLSANPGDLTFTSSTATGNTPVTVLLYGNNQTLPPGASSLPLVARALDGNGVPISGVGVNFTVTSGTVNPSIAATGADGYVETVFTAGSQSTDIGSFTINAGNLSQGFTVNVGSVVTVSPPAVLSIVSGQGQIVLADPSGNAVNTLEPFTVRATDANGTPVPNILVSFTWTSGYGLASFGSAGYGVGSGQLSFVVPTDDSGQAVCPFIPPPIFVTTYPGYVSDTITTSASGSTSVDFYVTGMPENASYCGGPTCAPVYPLTVRLLKPGSLRNVLTGVAGSTLKDSVEVWMGTLSGVPVPNIALQVNTGTDSTVPNSSCASPTGAGVALTNASGMATCDLVLNGVTGTRPLVISAGGVTFPDETLTITPGPPTEINIVGGNNQIGSVGTTLPQPFVVQVTDAFKNPISGVAVSWQVVSGPMTLSGATATTDSAGHASAIGILGGAGGKITIAVTAGSLSATFTAWASVPAGGITIVSGDAQSAQINVAFGAPLIVQVINANGSPAAFAGVNFSVASGSAVLGSTSVLADQTGLASMTVVAGPASGLVSIVASSGTFSVSFSLMVVPIGPSNVVIVNAASFVPKIAPGGLVTIFGTGLMPTGQGTLTSSTAAPGYSVSFGGTAAPILALVSQNDLQQINAQIPFEVMPGPNNVIIQTPQGSVTLNNIMISSLAPGIFTSGNVSASGYPYPQAVAVHVDGSSVTAARPAKRGEAITLFATGLGPTVPPTASNVAGVPGEVVANTVYAGVNHSGAAVISAVYQPGLIGVYAVTIQIPASTASGQAQPVSLYMVDASGTGYEALDSYLPIE
jgi:uncharacterized protein (TIGR03437 family)